MSTVYVINFSNTKQLQNTLYNANSIKHAKLVVDK